MRARSTQPQPPNKRLKLTAPALNGAVGRSGIRWGSIPFVTTSSMPRCGSLLVGQDSLMTMMIGIECGVVLAFDGGNLIAEHLRFAGDSISGEWAQSCFAGCSARGTLVAKRGV